MTYGHHIAAAGKDMRLAASNLAILQRGRAHHDEQRVSIDFELWSLMGAQRVLNGEVM